MNPEYLERMGANELNEYGKALGIDMAPAKTVEEKIKLIEGKRNKQVVIPVLGLELAVPKKRIRDQRITRIIADSMTDGEAEEAMTLLLGEDQMAEVVKACTDEDGTIDTVAMGYAFTEVFSSPALKNL